MSYMTPSEFAWKCQHDTEEAIFELGLCAGDTEPGTPLHRSHNSCCHSASASRSGLALVHRHVTTFRHETEWSEA